MTPGTGRVVGVTFLWLGATLGTGNAGASTVAEQRARLPPPSRCDDPVAGTWKSHTFDARRDQWSEFTLTIRRVPGLASGLQGEIVNESWYGPATEVQPGPCEGRLRYVVSMDATGTLSFDDRVSFGGVGTWRLDRVVCGDFSGDYFLDQFTGQLDRDLQEFQSVNNDGGVAFNEPTVFRRVACTDVPGPFAAEVQAPPFQPPRARGCW